MKIFWQNFEIFRFTWSGRVNSVNTRIRRFSLWRKRRKEFRQKQELDPQSRISWTPWLVEIFTPMFSVKKDPLTSNNTTLSCEYKFFCLSHGMEMIRSVQRALNVSPFLSFVSPSKYYNFVLQIPVLNKFQSNFVGGWKRLFPQYWEILTTSEGFHIALGKVGILGSS